MKLTIRNFRSIESLDIGLVKGVNFIYSEKNGAGKTNIAIAIIAALFGKIPVNHNLNALRKDEFGFMGKEHYVSLKTDNYEIDTDFNGRFNSIVLKGEKSERKEQWFKALDISGLQQKDIFRLITTKLFITSWAESIANIGNAERSKLLLSLFSVSFIDSLIQGLSKKKAQLVNKKNQYEGFIEGASALELLDIAGLKKQVLELEERVGTYANWNEDYIRDKISYWEDYTTSSKAELDKLNEPEALADIDREIEKKKKSIRAVKEKYAIKSISGDEKELLEDYRRTLARLNIEIQNLESMLEKTQLCPRCKVPLSFVDGKIIEFNEARMRARLKALENERKNLIKTKIEPLEASLQIEEMQKEIELLEERRKGISSSIREKRQSIESRIKKAENEVKKFKHELETLKTYEDEIKDYLHLKRELEIAEKIQETYKQAEEKRSELTRVENQLSDCNFLLQRALPSLKLDIIRDSCSYLQTKINEILEILGADGRIEFKPKVNKDGEVTEISLLEYNNGRWADFYSLNTGEQNILTLAANLAQSDAYPHKLDELGIIILDDIFGKLDDGKEERLGEYLHDLNKYVIITSCKRKAIDTIQPDNVIEVEKKDGKTILI